MFCGNFSHVDEEDSMAEPRTTKEPRSNQSSKANSKNPYSMRGLDKFSIVLAELGARREKILATAGPEGISLVQFMRKINSKDWVPIVVRLREEEQEKSRKAEIFIVKSQPIQYKRPEEAKRSQAETGESLFSSLLSYWPMVFALILLCLVLSGLLFAICCTSICWYLLPTLKGESGHARSVKKKKRNKKKKVMLV